MGSAQTSGYRLSVCNWVGGGGSGGSGHLNCVCERLDQLQGENLKARELWPQKLVCSPTACMHVHVLYVCPKLQGGIKQQTEEPARNNVRRGAHPGDKGKEASLRHPYPTNAPEKRRLYYTDLANSFSSSCSPPPTPNPAPKPPLLPHAPPPCSC